MEIKNIFRILVEQKSNLEDLLNITKEKQKSLVNNDRELLDECVSLEEKQISKIKGTEQERIEAIKAFNLKNGFPVDELRISSFVENIKDSIKPENLLKIISLESKLKSTVLAIGDLNQQNVILIQHSRHFISATINALLNTRKSAILDRKV